jgi:hypothetical protein
LSDFFDYLIQFCVLLFCANRRSDIQIGWNWKCSSLLSSSDHESPSATTSAGLFIPLATDDHDHESPSVTTAAGLFLPLATDDHEHESSSATKGGGDFFYL